MQTIYYGGDIITMRQEGDYVEALIEEDGIITFTGSLEEAGSRLKEDAAEWDLQGGCLIPAFIDGHSHILKTAQFVDYADLSGCTDFAEIVEALNRHRKEHDGEGGILLGKCYDHNFLAEGTYPDKTVLDGISDELPVFIFHTSLHAGAANSAMLKLAGIDRDTPDPEGGRFGRIPGTGKPGEPDGYVEEIGALKRILLAAAPYMKCDMDRQLADAQAEYLRHGVTTVQEGAIGNEELELLRQAGQKGILQVDVVAYLMAEQEPARAMEKHPGMAGAYENHVKLGGAKIVLDGSPQARTAWMSRPYEGETEYAGYPAMPGEETQKWASYAADHGLQLLAHCNGDAAGEAFLNAWEKSGAGRNLRPVMIHCQTVREDQLERMAELNMIPSIFVGHTYFWGDVHLKNLGEMRGNAISPARSAFDKGLRVNFHQDTPVTAPDMLFSMWCAVNRLTRKGRPIGKSQSVTPYEALEAVTANAAYAYFEEDSKGRLEAGMRADLAVLNRNPLKIPPMEIRDIQVLAVFKDGKCLYGKPG